MEPEFHGISVQVLIAIFDEFIRIYNDPAFVSSLAEQSGGRKELIGRLIEDKQRVVFQSHNVDPVKGFQLLPRVFHTFKPTDAIYQRLALVVKAEEALLVGAIKEQPALLPFQFDFLRPFDSILFPAPPCTYDAFIPGFFWIPRGLPDALSASSQPSGNEGISSMSVYEQLSNGALATDENSIPCIFHPAEIRASSKTKLNHPHAHFQHDQMQQNGKAFDIAAFSNLYLIYCHANATDMGQMESELTAYCQYFNVNIISMEYPGYGLSKGPTDAPTCKTDLKCVYLFLTAVLNIPAQSIVFFGRSVGSGPCAHVLGQLESQVPDGVGGLILQSPFTSVREVAKAMVGSVGFLSPNPFDNLKHLKTIHCPVLLIHGTEDKMIPPRHSEELFEACPSKEKELKLCPKADHNVWDFHSDLLLPIGKFLHLVLRRLQSDKDFVAKLNNVKQIPRALFSTVPFEYDFV